MNITLFGFPALVVWVGFLVVSAMPVWLAARLVRANHPTLWRAILSMIVGLLGALAAAAVFGVFGVLLAPISFLLSFKYILGTSVLRALLLAMLAAAGYAAIAYFSSGGLEFSNPGLKSATLTPMQGSCRTVDV